VNVDHRPAFPARYRPGIGVVGCGGVVRRGHLPAYEKYGCRVVGVHCRSEQAAIGLGAPVFRTLDDLLAHPDVEIVDIATPPEGRPVLVRRALDAAKHVLSQKPLADDLDEARALADAAERLGLRLAVNQNARWAPSWRVATLLVEQGAVGDVFSVTHLLEKRFDFVLESPRLDGLPHFLLYDYLVHWIDVSRCWLDGKHAVSVRALERRTAEQPPEANAPWSGFVAIDYADGSTAVIRSTGGSESPPRCAFWIHGTEATIRGAILHGADFVELDRRGEIVRFPLEGEWWPDGFAGTMAELVSAIAEDREPYNSARHNLLSLEFTLAACRSAEQDGQPVGVDEANEPRTSRRTPGLRPDVRAEPA
jgi:predicted dehydrogenase